MEITGTLIELKDPQFGQGKNGQWQKNEFIIETDGQYPKKVCLSAWGKTCEYLPSEIGCKLNVQFDVESREYNGRWYTDVKALKIEKLGGNKPATSQAQKQDAEYQNYAEERQSSASFDEATLPF